jgi:transposase
MYNTGMAKRKFTLTESERKELLQAYRTCKNAATRTRYQAVRLYGEGYPADEIEAIIGCSRSSLMGWCRTYRNNRSVGLVDKRTGGNRAKLGKLQIEELQQVLHQYTPRERLGPRASTSDGQFWRVEDLALLVREQYEVEYQSYTSYRHLLHLCGFSYQKSEKVFKSRNQSKVADFEEQLEKNSSM